MLLTRVLAFGLCALFACAPASPLVRQLNEANKMGPDYCPAHYRLAMEADRVDDGPGVEEHCWRTIECVRRVKDLRFTPLAAECEEIVHRVAQR